ACGVVGLKPSIEDISTDGVVPLSRLLDHVGPLTSSVRDAWLVYRALLGQSQRPGAQISWTDPRDALASATLTEVRLAVLKRYFCDVLDAHVRARFESTLERLRAAGARIGEADIPHAGDIAPVYMTIVGSEAAAYHAPALDTVPDRYAEPVRARLEAGRYLLAEDLSRALKGREVLRREVDAAIE